MKPMIGRKLQTFFLISASLLLAGCSNGNWGLNAVQLNSETVAYPENYRQRVVEVMNRNGIQIGRATISPPVPVVGKRPSDQRRWSVCVRGVAAPEREDQGWLPVDQALLSAIDPASQAGVYNLVFFFSNAELAPSLLTGYDSPLCRNLEFQPLRSQQ
jgi:hypothetical protein